MKTIACWKFNSARHRLGPNYFVLAASKLGWHPPKCVKRRSKTETSFSQLQMNWNTKIGTKTQKGERLENENEHHTSTAVAAAMAQTAAFITLAPADANAKKGAAAAAVIGKPIPINIVAEVEALKSGDHVAMACPRCKSLAVSEVQGGKGAVKETRAREQHQCPERGTVIKATGMGRAATAKAVHFCKNCGSEPAFCCAIKKE